MLDPRADSKLVFAGLLPSNRFCLMVLVALYSMD